MSSTVLAAPGDILAKLQPNDFAVRDYFGSSAAISGNTAIIGSAGDDDNGNASGSAYLFDVTTGGQIAKLLPNDGEEGDQFGRAVAISGNTAIAGHSWDDENGYRSGAAYLFDVTTGGQIAKLLPDDGERLDQFGRTVAISGNTAIINSSSDSGSAYLFDVTTGNQIAKLQPNDDAANNAFGSSVSISGNTAIVGSATDRNSGAYGSAYLFDVTTGDQIGKLLPNDGEAGYRFGDSVSISGNTAIVGSIYNDGFGTYHGSAYLFDITTGNQIAKLLPDEGPALDLFGQTVSISGNIAIVGSTEYRGLGASYSRNLAYLFDVTTGNQIAKLLSDDGLSYLSNPSSQAFGTTLSTSGNIAIVGSNGEGTAYLFEVPEPTSLALLSLGGLVLLRQRHG